MKSRFLSRNTAKGIRELFRIPIRRLRAKLQGFRRNDYLIVLNWHQISPIFESGCHHEYTWTSISDFKKEVGWLKNEFQILPLNEAVDRLKCKSLRGPCAALTFDDGDISMADHVLPFLQQQNLPAIFFVNTAYLNAQRSYWFPIANYFRNNDEEARRAGFSQELKDAAVKLRRLGDPAYYQEWRSRIEAFASSVPDLTSRLVSTEWLAGLDGKQFAIGAHGHEHQRFSMMPLQWQRDDLQENIRTLARFKAFKPIFAVPFGREFDWTQETLIISRELGLEAVLADGGVNVKAGAAYRRIPSDNRKLKPLIADAIVGR